MSSCCSTTAGVASLSSNCCPSEEAAPYKPSCLSRAIEMVGRVALTVFAFVLAPLYTSITYTLGLLCGFAYALAKDIKRPMNFQGEGLRPVCAQGYLERLSGKRWPVPITQLVTDFFIGLHTYHDPKIFGPLFCGLFTGFWSGRFAVNGTADLGRRLWKKEKSPPPPPLPHPGSCGCPH